MNTNNNNNQQVNKEKSSDDVEMTELTQLDKDKAVVQAQMEVCERTREEVRKVIAPAPVDHDASDLWTNAVNPASTYFTDVGVMISRYFQTPNHLQQRPPKC
ncbi:hypothetical protein [Absidia glauca]|uniref:Uncharacterized protein n=1 Tax=Absidia glauca TaxID=4829 RepID=A0A163KLD7_ABSGL|nr:hypothetical protein [Absidia glauca]